MESLAQEREETIDQYEERILELEDEVNKLSKDHEEELQQVASAVQISPSPGLEFKKKTSTRLSF